MTERPGVLHMDGWAGRVEYPVTIIGETPKRFRVRLLMGTRLPGRREGYPGDVLLVPKSAVTDDEPISRPAQCNEGEKP